MRSRQVLTLGFAMIAAVVASGVAPAEREAGACSCESPPTWLMSPDRVYDAPVNAHVRYETIWPRFGGHMVRAVLRAHGGAAVDTTSREVVTGGVASVELVPRGPLASHTQYELVVETPNAFPSTEVIGTFRTGEDRDTTAPLFEAPWGAKTFYNRTSFTQNCTALSPWATVRGVHGNDPGRPNAQLVYGVWSADAAGKIDTKQPPTAVLQPDENGVLLIGPDAQCDARQFPLPENGIAQIGIAAIDEAGNTSPLRRLRLDMSAAQQP